MSIAAYPRTDPGERDSRTGLPPRVFDGETNSAFCSLRSSVSNRPPQKDLTSIDSLILKFQAGRVHSLALNFSYKSSSSHTELERQ
jgi:hypothetical protein